MTGGPLGGLERGAAEQILEERGGDALSAPDHDIWIDKIQHQAPPVQLDQPAPRIPVRERKLGGMVDPVGVPAISPARTPRGARTDCGQARSSRL
jgi:hypothetical protein